MLVEAFQKHTLRCRSECRSFIKRVFLRVNIGKRKQEKAGMGRVRRWTALQIQHRPHVWIWESSADLF
jgi:hypothetical protein